MRRVLILGGGGFIGSHLAAGLARSGGEVHVVLRPSSDDFRVRDMVDTTQLHRVSLEDRDDFAALLQRVQPDCIYHLAMRTRWPGPANIGNANESLASELGVLFNVLEAASRACPQARIVRSGSLAEYGDGVVPYVETQREKPLNVYAASLVAGTHYLQMLQKNLPNTLVTARLALTYGERQNQDFLVPSLLRSCLSRTPITIKRPQDRRDLIHVSDVVTALRLMGEADLPRASVINIATGLAPTMRDVAELIVSATGAPHDLLTFGDGSTNSDAPEVILGSTELAYKLMGWKARVSYKDGITSLVASMRAD